MIGAVIIKHKLCLSDVDTVQQIQKTHNYYALSDCLDIDAGYVCSLTVCGNPPTYGVKSI